MGFSNVRADAILNQEYRTGDVYLALFLNDPTPEATGTEVSGGGYERIKIPFSEPVTENGKRTIKNTVELQSVVAVADWGKITHIAIMDAPTGGTLISSNPLQKERTVDAGERFVILLGGGVIGLR